MMAVHYSVFSLWEIDEIVQFKNYVELRIRSNLLAIIRHYFNQYFVSIFKMEFFCNTFLIETSFSL